MSSRTATSVSSSSTADKTRHSRAGAPDNTGQQITSSTLPSAFARADDVPEGGNPGKYILDPRLREGDASRARCFHFGECGGCQLQHLDYPAQLAHKAALVESFLKPAGWADPVSVRPSPDPWYYRNKMEFSFQDVYPKPSPGEDYLLLGLKRRKRWDKVLNISECYLMSPETPKLIAAVHAWAREQGLEPYNLHRKTGFLRHLVVREGKATGERMVLLVTSPGELPRKSFVAAVCSAYPATTVLWGVNGRAADIARTDGVEALSGPGFITEIVLGKRFRISPYSFFQTNSRGAAELYGRIRSWVQDIRAGNVLDLYCGSGGIALSIADACERVIGVESAASAVEDARANASNNGVLNSEFIESKTEEALPRLLSRDFSADAVIADPPRCGLHPKTTEDLLSAQVPWMVYVSCNPKALAQDVERLSSGYELRRVEAVDLFPHTEHVETLALLQGRPLR